MGKKPIIAIANSFDEFLPGHVHLNKVGRIVSEAIKEAGGIPREFNTMAVDDGIAMGHTGMLYSLPSRDIIADTVEYQCNAHCAGMFTANSMNCLTEAIGLALPGNGTILASHSYRKDLFKRAAQQVVKIAHQYYDDSDDSVLPRSIATKEAFENAMTMDVAMGGSTNTVLHILAMAQSADVDFTLDDIERISHTVPCICKASPSGKWEISDIHRAGGITGILGELDRAGKLHTKGIGKQVAMLTDGRYSGGSSGLAIGHMAPEAANKGPVALIKNGDIIDIDIEARSVNVELTDEQLAERRRELEAGDGYVAHRDRKVSQALKAYAAFARSADKGATRDPELINKLSGLA